MPYEVHNIHRIKNFQLEVSFFKTILKGEIFEFLHSFIAYLRLEARNTLRKNM